jgi:hypothetical protein
MEWVKFVVPLIAVAVWILANLARAPKEPPRPPARRPPVPPPDVQGKQAPPSPPTDVDRFLQEVARRRKEAAERRQAGPSELAPLGREEPKADKPPPPVAVPVEVVPAPRRLAPRERLPEKKSKPRSAETSRDIPEVRPVRSQPRVLEVVQVPAPPPPGPVAPPPGPPPAPTADANPGQVTPTAASQVLALLANQATLPVCFLMHEIFQPPLSRRPSRRV